jgi:hypothetical protein
MTTFDDRVRQRRERDDHEDLTDRVDAPRARRPRDSCPLDGATLAEVDAAEQADEKAASQGAQVVVLRHETAWLREHGEIAALLRW